jgi:DNA-binding IclR family transcriptional regulator
MVFPAHEVTGGLIALATLTDEQVESLYAAGRYADRPGERPDMTRLLADLHAVRKTGVAVNLERSERGLSAVGVPVHDAAGNTVAAVSVSMPALRYEPERVARMVAALNAAATSISRQL